MGITKVENSKSVLQPDSGLLSHAVVCICRASCSQCDYKQLPLV